VERPLYVGKRREHITENVMTFSVSLRRAPWLVLVSLAWLAAGTQTLAQADPLPSWNGGAAKKAIIAMEIRRREVIEPLCWIVMMTVEEVPLDDASKLGVAQQLAGKPVECRRPSWGGHVDQARHGIIQANVASKLGQPESVSARGAANVEDDRRRPMSAWPMCIASVRNLEWDAAARVLDPVRESDRVLGGHSNATV
jgi:hypothetical protein